MVQHLDAVSVGVLFALAVFRLLVPFRPTPHVVETLVLLKNGTLTRPIDLFDWCFHLAPTVLFGAKLSQKTRRG